MDSTGRSAGLEEDFISPLTSNEKGSPHGGDEEAAEVGEHVRLNETRLSDVRKIDILVCYMYALYIVLLSYYCHTIVNFSK